MKPRAEKDKNYEERHREERKAKSLVWGTSVPRKRLIEAGYKVLLEEAAKREKNGQ